MKRLIAVFLSIFMVGTLLMGCGSTTGADENDTRIKVVATIFPEYDWVRQIMGEDEENINLILLMNNGTDLHSFQPTAQDIADLSTADLLIYVGGESDTWVEEALKEKMNPNMRTINLMEVLGDSVQEEEIVEGMQEEEHDHDHEDGEEEGHEHEDEEEVEYDEHVWLSLRNAQRICEVIADELSELIPERAAVYEENLIAYETLLDELDHSYEDMVAGARLDTILFADRFPFRYLVDDYGLNYYAAFSGCTTETDASFETITFLGKKIDELQLNYVFTIEKSDDSIAKSVIQVTTHKDQEILILDSMQATTESEMEEGKTYVGVMAENFMTLSKALM